MTEVKVKAYAKINLLLDVIKKRDDGYHEVEMVMQAIDLFDEVTIKPAEKITVSTNHPLVPDDERNLAYKGAVLLKEDFPFIPGVEIKINKQIPVEAGLAGGSTDAAAVLEGMDKLFSLNLGKEEKMKVAAKLGSDVPFCLNGPTAIARGRGELITEIEECPLLWVVLVKPPFGVKTPEVYKNLKLTKIKNHPDTKKYITAIIRKETDYILSNIVNILENSTFELYPEVKIIKDNMKKMGAKNVLMSGSGPTVFALFAEKKEAQFFYEKIKKTYKQVYLSKTITKKEILERVKMSG